MKLSEFIKELQRYQKDLGDVELYKETNDGHATWASDAVPRISYREIWKGHSAGKKWFIDLTSKGW